MSDDFLTHLSVNGVAKTRLSILMELTPYGRLRQSELVILEKKNALWANTPHGLRALWLQWRAMLGFPPKMATGQEAQMRDLLEELATATSLRDQLLCENPELRGIDKNPELKERLALMDYQQNAGLAVLIAMSHEQTRFPKDVANMLWRLPPEERQSVIQACQTQICQLAPDFPFLQVLDPSSSLSTPEKPEEWQSLDVYSSPLIPQVADV